MTEERHYDTYDSLKTAGQLPDYTEAEQEYYRTLRANLVFARDQRDQTHDEFNGLTYLEYYDENAKASLSYIPPRQNKEDVNVVTGTTREKKLSIMSNVLNLNLETTVRAYNKESLEETVIGSAFTDALRKSEELEDWEYTGRILAYDELTSQGNVFIEEKWDVKRKLRKKKISFNFFKSEKELQDYKPEQYAADIVAQCKRQVIPGPMVYLGNIKEFEIEEQPFLYTHEVVPYELAKAVYGNWTRWKYVPKALHYFEETFDDVYGTNFRVQESTPDGWVEIVKYQDKWNDNYQIIINGIMMLPCEFPMPWESGEYNIIKGNLEPLGPNFAYCGGIPAKTKMDQAILDEMYRLAILKGQKSFAPPIANYSSNLLSHKSFLPGKVHNDLERGEIEVLGGDPSAYALKGSEFQMIQLIKNFIDEKSLNPIAEGQAPQGNPTATEVERIAAQAKIKLGLTIHGFISLQRKLGSARLNNILENWTKPTGTVVDPALNEVVAEYMSFSVKTSVDGEGEGEKIIQFTESPIQSPEELADLEEGIKRDATGRKISKDTRIKPRRITQINPAVLKSIRLKWYIEVTPSEKETSLISRMVFDDRLQKAMAMFGPQAINIDYAKTRWAAMNNIPYNKFFNVGMTAQMPGQLEQQIAEQGIDPNAMAPKKPEQPSINKISKQ